MVDAPVMDASFPVIWSDPADAEVTWKHDPMHFPRPVSSLFQTVWGPSFEYGLTNAAHSLSIPLRAVRVRFHNGYEYEHQELAIPASEDEAREMDAKTEAAMRTAIGQLMDRWQGDFLPRLLMTRERLRTMDVATPSAGEVVALIDEAVAISHEDWLIHFQLVLPAMLAMELFDEFYVDLFGGDAADAHVLLVGQPSKTVLAGIALAQLASDTRDAGLQEVVVSLPADEVLAALHGSDEGRVLAAKIGAYLEEFGLRQDLFDFITPTWQEHPSIVIATLQGYLRSGHDAAAVHELAVRRAEGALSAARATLAGYPEQMRGQFEGMVQAARMAYLLKEDHNFYIDQQGPSLLRLFFLRVGHRLVAEGNLAHADDVFMLKLDEVKSAVLGRDARAIAAERWKEFERQRQMIVLPFIGLPPAGPPPMDNPMMRAMARFFGGPPQQADAPNQLKGNAGSRGTVRGTARVALSLDDAKHLQPGEILVTLSTLPAWTPLFGAAAAVVTETGGPLSHCAVVAREYAIPAVVGAFGATRAIRTGQTILVDGDRGLVTLE